MLFDKRPLDRNFAWPLLLAFAGVIVAFVAATFYSQSGSRAIDGAASSIATNAGPSIEHLSAGRTALRQLLLIEDDYFDATVAGQHASLDRIRDSQRVVEAELEGYLSLPRYPGEAEVWIATKTTLDEVDVALDRLIATPTSNLAAFREAHVRFQQTVESAATALARSVRINVAMARELALEIRQMSDDTRRLAFSLDLLCALATLAGGVLLWRALRSHQRLQRAYQEALERRSDELEAFAGRVAHDVRSGLSGLSMSLDRLERIEGDVAIVTAVERGRRSLRRVVQLVDGLLGFARAGARPEPGARVDIAEALTDAVAYQRGDADAAGCQLVLENGASGWVSCSAGVLGSLVSNLVGNAIKYIGAGERRIVVRGLDRGAQVRVEVEDTGPGVPDELRTSIFQPFVRASGGTPGVGLGLATVKRLAEGHGGHAGMDPVPGGGSLFWFELPRAPIAAFGPEPIPAHVR